MNLPATIYSPEMFLKSPSAGFDGVFDWSWTKDCFGETKITPMDFDGVVERRGNFLLFETKKPGKNIPTGQLITLQSAHKLGCFTIMIIQGKETPEVIEVWYQNGTKKTYHGINEAKRLVKKWFEHASATPKRIVDVSFLHKRIAGLETDKELLCRQIESAKMYISQAMQALALENKI